MRRKWTRLALMLLVCSLSPLQTWPASIQEVQTRKKLVMLCHPDPMAFVQRTADGQFDGLDVAIVKTFANSLGVALEIHATQTFGELIPALLSGKGDLIASSMTITKDREKVVAFSQPYFPVVMMVVVRKDSTISNVSGLSGKKAAITRGTIMEDRLKDIPGVQYVDSPDSNAQYASVRNGKADYAVLDSTSVIGDISKFPDLKIAFHFPERYDYGFAFSQGSDLREAMNAHLSKMQESGLLYTTIRRHLGDNAVDMLNLIKNQKQ